MKSGILLLDKEEGVSSAAAIADVKKHLRLAKIGHAGTLDPFATGLLVCLVGHATRLASYAASGRKTYSGIIKFGEKTTTDDITGEVIERAAYIPPFNSINSVVKNFIGEIEQRPPSISAIHVNGKRAYQRVREDGEELTLAPRKVYVESFELKEFDSNRVSFNVTCGSGTYIRSLARDLGETLGSFGTLESLRREESLPFKVSMAKKVTDLTLEDVKSWDILFPEAKRISVEREDAKQLLGGDVRALSRIDSDGEMAMYCFEDRLLGLLVRKSGRWEFGVNFPYEV